MRDSHFALPVAAAAVFLLLSSPSVVTAQKVKIPDPVETSLETKDGLQLKVTYYPPIEDKIDDDAGKQVVVKKVPAVLRQTVPIIMLHEYMGSREDFKEAASRLQAKGHAVIVPDLRGHGDSTLFTDGREIAAAALKPADFTLMGQDVRAVKKFLMKENNEGRLNIEKLCIVGAEMGASLAANFAVYDWSRRQLPGAKKRGMDVRALVLLSPQISFRGLPMSTFTKTPKFAPPLAKMHAELSIMIVVGKNDPKSYRSAKRFRDSIRLKYPVVDGVKRLRLFVPNTKLQSVEMLNAKALRVQDDVATFVDLRLVKRDFPWTNRAREQAGD
ncbi:MAG: alpha/beta fold hydrolase [Planctomycetes bacterium]|nr:alpha/beta fold hydrolase [Planctomycetota bacterium]